MQLTLLRPLAQQHRAAARTAPALRPSLPSRDAVSRSQLDRIAAANLRTPKQGLGGAAMLIAFVGGLVLLGSASLWRAPRDLPQSAEPLPAETAPLPNPRDPATPAVAAPLQTPPSHSAGPAPEVTIAAPVEVAPLAVATSLPPADSTPVATVPAAADAAPAKSRSRPAVEARRRAQQPAQERLLAAETLRAQQVQQKQGGVPAAEERALQRTAVQVEPPAPVLPEAAARRSVQSLCASSGNFLSANFCYLRECGKSEHSSDAMCIRLGELRDAQLRLAADH
jgi:hypothetical protein